jgi:membrane protease YdiL (CAAX protease family)
MTQRSKGILWFVVLAFAISWSAIFGIYLLGGTAPAAGETLPNPLVGLLSMIGTFGPALAAVIVRKWITREGFQDAGLRLNFKAGWKYYLVAFLFPFFTIPIALGVAVLYGARITGLSAESLATIIPLFVISIFLSLLYFGEEFGWRGYLQNRIAPGKPLLAALLTGLVWGVWHFAIVISGISLAGNLTALLIYPLDCFIGSIFFGWLFTKSTSVWPVCLAHAVGNTVVTGVMAMLLPDLPQLVTWAVFTLAGNGLLALVLVLTRQVKWREAPA